jgi:hypothetical protein
MTPRAYALAAVLAVLLACAAAAARPGPRPCTFTTLPDGTTMIRCPRG